MLVASQPPPAMTTALLGIIDSKKCADPILAANAKSQSAAD
jgi:hypothetical protein